MLMTLFILISKLFKYGNINIDNVKWCHGTPQLSTSIHTFWSRLKMCPHTRVVIRAAPFRYIWLLLILLFILKNKEKTLSTQEVSFSSNESHSKWKVNNHSVYNVLYVSWSYVSKWNIPKFYNTYTSFMVCIKMWLKP